MDQSLFETSEALVADSFCAIVLKRVKLLHTKKLRFESFLRIRNMNDKKLVFRNYPYILEKLKFLQNFVFLLVFWESPYKIPQLPFSSKFDWGSHIVSITKTASKNIGALICSMKFVSPEVALYLYKSYVLAWNIFVMSGQVRRTVGPSLAASLEPLAHHPNAASLSLFL